MPGAADALFIPFQKVAVAWPQGAQRWLWLNAQALETRIDRDLLSHFVCEQPFRPDFLDLQARGFNVASEIKVNTYQGSLIVLGKHRGENEAMVCRASMLLPAGAPIIVAGDKQSGIAPMRKRLMEVTEIIESFSKYHATVFVLENSKAIADVIASEKPQLVEGRYKTAPGMFSHDRIDTASRLLADHITPNRIKGDVGDFGAGWGYLGSAVLEIGAPRTLTLFEAHWPSLQSALANLEELSGDVPVLGEWADLTREGPSRRFDAIVMNPPFHRGSRTDPDIGKAFIRAASAALKPGGILLMVANTKLPYEETLSVSFRRVTELDKRDGFKLFEAVR